MSEDKVHKITSFVGLYMHVSKNGGTTENYVTSSIYMFSIKAFWMFLSNVKQIL